MAATKTMNYSKPNTLITALGFSTLLLLVTACDNEGNLPKTFDAYQGKNSFIIRDLNPKDKALLYRDSFSQNEALVQKSTLPVFTQCMDDTLRKHSSFMVLYKIYKICEAKILQGKP